MSNNICEISDMLSTLQLLLIIFQYNLHLKNFCLARKVWNWLGSLSQDHSSFHNSNFEYISLALIVRKTSCYVLWGIQWCINLWTQRKYQSNTEKLRALHSDYHLNSRINILLYSISCNYICFIYILTLYRHNYSFPIHPSIHLIFFKFF